MTTEAQAEQIIQLLKEISGKLGGGTSTSSASNDDDDLDQPARPGRGRPKKEAAPATTGKPKKFTADELRVAGKDYIDKHGAGELKNLLARFGLKKVSEAQEDQYGEIMKYMKGGPEMVNGSNVENEDDDLV